MVALRKGAIVIFVVALGYMIIALQARSAELRPEPGIVASVPASGFIAD